MNKQEVKDGSYGWHPLGLRALAEAGIAQDDAVRYISSFIDHHLPFDEEALHVFIVAIKSREGVGGK